MNNTTSNNPRTNKDIESNNSFLLEQHKVIMEEMIGGSPLKLTLIKIIEVYEQLFPHLKGSIMILDSEGKAFTDSYSPGLNPNYLAAFRGLEIGSDVGCCGTAAYCKKPVIASDISTSVLWEKFADFAAEYQLTACWSVPIMDKHDTVLGTFAMYYDKIAEPCKEQLRVMEIISGFASLAILKDRAERDLVNTQAKFQGVFADTSAAMLIVDLAGKVLESNEAARILFGYTELEFKQIGYIDLLSKEEHDSAFRLEKFLLESKDGKAKLELNHLHKNRSVVRAILNSSLIRHDSTDAPYYIASIEDVTYRKEAEQKIKSQNDELIKANRELDQFVYSASHDLRAPLASIVGLVDVSRDAIKEGDDLSEYLDLIETSAKQLDNFIFDLVSYSRNARLEVEYKNINLSKVAKEVFDNHSKMDKAARVALDVQSISDNAFEADELRVRMVLNNLISNAILYSKDIDSAFIKVSHTIDNKQHVIKVADNGTGIEADYLPKIFDMFYRISGDKSGSGLGLYIVKEAVDKMEGSITVESKIKEGTTFTVQFPVR